MTIYNADAAREAQKRLDELTALTESRERVLAILEDRQQKLADLTERYRTTVMVEADYAHDRAMLQADIEALSTTGRQATGTQEVWTLMKQVGWGLRDLDLRIERLRREYEDWQRRATTNPEGTAMYRLVRGNHYRDGRRVQPGEVVELTHRQAEAWSDLFEPV
ncbi:MAG: hypothetical protein JSU08_16880 [Acidobacteria bacterium]|nr:hypothetical protein [Acidobacteriota bacterium]